VSHIVGVALLPDIGRGLREAFFMLWETLWALVLGFALSGTVRAFVPKTAMRRALGTHGPRAIAKASGYGMVSSSCSYAASAMAKTFFQKGADLVTAMVFMFASTNLVLELGVVMLVLLGWQFTVGEFVGGPVMIVLLAVIGGLVLRGPLVEQARRRLMGTGGEQPPGEAATHDHQAMESSRPWRARLSSRAGWTDAASYSVADAKMLRWELLVGFVVAGLLSVLVPNSWWNALFLHGHGFWTDLENALVGPIIAMLSWVCSIGNVPLAAAFLRGGISFGGVIAFVFADLLAMPLVLIYRKYYGGRLTLRLVALFYLVMAAAGLAVQGIFAIAGATPHVPARLAVATSRFSWDYTTLLNVAAIFVGALLYWLYRHRARLGGAAELVIDPVCGMQISASQAPARLVYEGAEVHFCSDRCRECFEAEPERYASAKALEQTASP
jgi:uncharacterized membrane protein YraQ (UPF0718 family)/YHS domain-containing protein